MPLLGKKKKFPTLRLTDDPNPAVQQHPPGQNTNFESLLNPKIPIARAQSELNMLSNVTEPSVLQPAGLCFIQGSWISSINSSSASITDT